MIKSLKERRTIRQYLDKEIDDRLLNELLETAFRAPTTGNMQVYSVVVTRTRENKERLAPAHFNQPTVTHAPVVLTFCADFNRFVKWCELNHAQPGYDNFQSFVTAAIDALLEDQRNVMIGIRNNEIEYIPFNKAIKNDKPIDRELLNTLRKLSI